MIAALEKRFPGVDWKREAVAGVTTFFTMAYIVVVNPSILATPGTGMAFSGVLTATVLLAFTMTLLMGLYAKLPFAVAPGMGINAFFTFTLILGPHRVPWPTALGIVFWAGVLFLVVSITPLRERIAQAIPHSLRCAAAAGIGVFLTFIGLKNATLIEADPATLVRLAQIDRRDLLALGGVAVIAWLMRRKSRFAFLGGIGAATLGALLMGMIHMPKTVFELPDFHSVFFKADIFGALKLSLVPAILSLLFTDLFDSLSTFIGVSQAAGLVDRNGQMPRMKEGLVVDSLATLFAGLFGTSSGTAYIESSAGIEMGGRTGLTSFFTALCFLPCFFLAPLAGMVPAYATAPVLIVVGALMFKSAMELPFEKIEDMLPTYLTIVLIPLTFSITQGILWGFVSHVGLYLLAGRRKEIAPMMYGIALLSVGLLWLEHG
jgi:AGZA family xanthine/uracil permease-like MFS transporter